jgi:hypothetical protein
VIISEVIESTMKDKIFEDTLVGLIKTFKFTKMDITSGPTMVEYPFDFYNDISNKNVKYIDKIYNKMGTRDTSNILFGISKNKILLYHIYCSKYNNIVVNCKIKIVVNYKGKVVSVNIVDSNQLNIEIGKEICNSIYKWNFMRDWKSKANTEFIYNVEFNPNNSYCNEIIIFRKK